MASRRRYWLGPLLRPSLLSQLIHMPEMIVVPVSGTAQLKMDRAELEAIVDGELSSHEKALFDGLDQNGKGFLTVDDIHLLAKQVRFSL